MWRKTGTLFLDISIYIRMPRTQFGWMQMCNKALNFRCMCPSVLYRGFWWRERESASFTMQKLNHLLKLDRLVIVFVSSFHCFFSHSLSGFLWTRIHKGSIVNDNWKLMIRKVYRKVLLIAIEWIELVSSVIRMNQFGYCFKCGSIELISVSFRWIQMDFPLNCKAKRQYSC